MSGKKAKQRSRTTQSAPATQLRRPVHTQPLVGVDADIERVNHLGRVARKLLGGKPTGDV